MEQLHWRMPTADLLAEVSRRANGQSGVRPQFAADTDVGRRVEDPENLH
jgi:hypothetical protein